MRRALAKRPKRLFHAIVACGVTITACGTATSTSTDGGSDGAADAHDKDAADASPGFDSSASDAQDDTDAFDPPDVVDEDVETIKPPPPIIH